MLMSTARIVVTSPLRIPVMRCSWIMAATWGDTWGSTASTNASGTGRTGWSLWRCCDQPVGRYSLQTMQHAGLNQLVLDGPLENMPDAVDMVVDVPPGQPVVDHLLADRP